MLNPQTVQKAAETKVRVLYGQLLDSWSKRNARDFAALFEEDANQIGFDGSQVRMR